MPTPILILGIGPRWDGPRDPATACPGCGGRGLGMVECCVMCDRSGVDHLLEPVEKPRPRRSPKAVAKSVTAAAEPAPAELAGGLGSPAVPGKIRGPKLDKPKRKRFKSVLRAPGGFEAAPNSFDLKALRASLDSVPGK